MTNRDIDNLLNDLISIVPTRFDNKMDLVRIKAEAKQALYNLLVEAMMGAIGEERKRKPTHGTCCTCQTCGYPNDNECECDRNEVIAEIRTQTLEVLNQLFNIDGRKK